MPPKFFIVCFHTYIIIFIVASVSMTTCVFYFLKKLEIDVVGPQVSEQIVSEALVVSHADVYSSDCYKRSLSDISYRMNRFLDFASKIVKKYPVDSNK